MTKVVLTIGCCGYREIVCELEKDGMFYAFPKDADIVQMGLLSIGDELRVEEIEDED